MRYQTTKADTYDSILTQTSIQLSDEIASSHQPMVSTKFNPYSGVLLHLISTHYPNIPVVWVDTGYNTRDTLAFAQYLQALLSLNLKIYKPVNQEYMTPPEVESAEHAEFVRRVKLEPCSRAIESLSPDIWFSSLRKSQTSHRNQLAERETVSATLTKVYPLLEWNDNLMEHYLSQNGIAKGPECYDPTKGDSKRECGLHTQRWIDSVHSSAQGTSIAQ